MPNVALPWRHWLVRSFIWASYTSLLMVGLLLLAYFVSPTTMKQLVAALPPKSPPTSSSTSPSDDQKIIERAQSEFVRAYGDHWHIALWVANCLGFASIEEMPKILAGQLTPFGVDEWTGTDAKIEKSQSPTVQQRAIAQLSLNLHRQRMAAAGSVRDASKEAEIMQWIIIGLGLITTVTISLSSTEYGRGDENWKKSLRLFAITLPAIGTAVAAVNAFYVPSQKAVQAARTLSSLGQLHNQIALDVWAAGCANDTPEEKPKWEKIDNAIKEWTKRYQEAQAFSGIGKDVQPGSESPAGATSTSTGSKKSQ